MMHHVPRTRLTVLAVAGPVERVVRPHSLGTYFLSGRFHATVPSNSVRRESASSRDFIEVAPRTTVPASPQSTAVDIQPFMSSRLPLSRISRYPSARWRELNTAVGWFEVKKNVRRSRGTSHVAGQSVLVRRLQDCTERDLSNESRDGLASTPSVCCSTSHPLGRV
jgi:hypothetical protein